jgi:DNA modification methylase
VKIRDRIKELRRVPARDLLANPKNWRTHPPSQQRALKGLLAELGYCDALLARELSDSRLELINGHLRRDVTPDTEVPVLVLDVSEAEADKLLATLDPLASLAEANREALTTLVASVDTECAAVQAMLADLAAAEVTPTLDSEPTAGQIDPDDIPAPPDEATTRPGDLWILGSHRLLCGDSAKSTDVDRLLGGAVVHLVNTDPRFGVKVEPRSNNAISAGLSPFEGTTDHQSLDLARHPDKATPTDRKLRPRDRPQANDFVAPAEFEQLLHGWFANLARVLEPGRSFYIWGGESNLPSYLHALAANGLFFGQAIIWNTLHPVLTRKDFMGCFELAFYGWRKGAHHKFFGPNNALDLWEVKTVNPQNLVHLTEKPVELASRALQYSSQPGENVLDLFGGSGSTLIAAEQTGRRAFLMEQDALSCDVIRQRWSKFTGKEPALRERAGSSAPCPSGSNP